MTVGTQGAATDDADGPTRAVSSRVTSRPTVPVPPMGLFTELS